MLGWLTRCANRTWKPCLHPAQQLHKLVDGFTVMTYDASRPERPGFNAPLPWVENNVRLLVDAEHAVEQRAKVDKLDEEPEPCALSFALDG